jgi:hypothetical protein
VRDILRTEGEAIKFFKEGEIRKINESAKMHSMKLYISD